MVELRLAVLVARREAVRVQSKKTAQVHLLIIPPPASQTPSRDEANWPTG
jgi:hypothetical protein